MSMRNNLKSCRPRVAIVGAGVIGTSTALALLRQAPHCSLTIYSSQQTPNTTGDGAAGLWNPNLPGGTSSKDIIRWSKATWDVLESWYKSGDPGMVSCPFILITDKLIDTPDWSGVPSGFRKLSHQELAKYGQTYRDGYTFMTYTAEASVFLPHLTRDIQFLGGKFVNRHINELQELYDEADVIINCSGLGSRELAGDSTVYPVRGQVMRVNAPWVKTCILDESEEGDCYIIPNTDTIVLGGTHQEDDWRTNVDQQDRDRIWTKCTEICPSLKRASVLKDWVGLRPVRSKGVRLEMEDDIEGQTRPKIIHNYGHGGSGVTLFWGCALEASHLALRAITKMIITPQAKL